MYERRINSFYGIASIAYKNFLYLDATIRRDASSTLPIKENTYSYPSLSGSFIFTDALRMKENGILSFGKLRASAAEVGNDTDPYMLNLYYGLMNRPFKDQVVGAISTTTLPPTNLKPTRTRSFEAGTELRFLKNRIHLDFTYYTQKSRDQINLVPLPVSSGFGTQIINAGTITNQGIEVLIGGTPVVSKDFNWDISVNFARNKNVDISFIEEMPLGVITEHDRGESLCSSDEVRELIRQRHELLPTTDDSGGPARYYRMADSPIRVGFISPHSHNFCSTCNRVRVTVEGRLLLCLGNEHSVDLRRVLRGYPEGDQKLRQTIIDSMDLKPERHHFSSDGDVEILRFMNMTGG